MILTCPACGTRYVVKDGAIPEGGRQVRCASCKTSWHQDPDESAADDQSLRESSGDRTGETPQPAPRTHPSGEPGGKSPESRLGDHAHPDDAIPDEIAGSDPDASPLPEPSASAPLTEPLGTEQRAPVTALDPAGSHDAGTPAEQSQSPAPSTASTPAPEPANSLDANDDYSPFAPRAADQPRSRWPLYALLALVAIAALALAIWFLAPTQLQQRLGVAGPSTDTPLLLQVEQHSRQQLASGNQLLEVSGRVINPTDQAQRVPPLQAQLRSLGQEVVYRWTIPPPAQTLAPGGSASFNSAELNIPPSAACLDVSFGGRKKSGPQAPCRPAPAEAPAAAG